jgi:hypothetical protein
LRFRIGPQRPYGQHGRLQLRHHQAADHQLCGGFAELTGKVSTVQANDGPDQEPAGRGQSGPAASRNRPPTRDHAIGAQPPNSCAAHQPAHAGVTTFGCARTAVADEYAHSPGLLPSFSACVTCQASVHPQHLPIPGQCPL